MSSSELDRLKRLCDLSEQITSMAVDGSEARQGITRLIARAEHEIKAKVREIELHKQQIELLKHLGAVLGGTKPKAKDDGQDEPEHNETTSTPKITVSAGKG